MNTDTPTVVDPVRVSRAVFLAVRDMHLNEGVQTSHPALLDTLEKYSADAVTYFKKRWSTYQKGVEQGFSIKRYRLWFRYVDNHVVILREQEDLAELERYSEALTINWANHNYVLKPNEDGSIGVYQSDGVRKHCDLHLTVIKDKLTPVGRQRQPAEGEPKLEKGEVLP